MSTVAGVQLADVIVALASAVADANAVLDSDPNSSYGITKFEVDTKITAVIRVPASKQSSGSTFRPVEPGLFAIETFRPSIKPGLVLGEVLQPTLREAMLPAATQTSAQIGVKAVIEPVPNVPS